MVKRKSYVVPRKRLECQCDLIMKRNPSSKKKGLYRVYKTSKKMILQCYMCKVEQRFKIVPEQTKEIGLGPTRKEILKRQENDIPKEETK